MAGSLRSQSSIRQSVLVPRLLQIREWAALSQEDLAERAGVSRATVTRAEKGLPIRVSSVRKLARALRVSPRQLQAGDDEPTAS